jgi:hypothetical protein
MERFFHSCWSVDMLNSYRLIMEVETGFEPV